MCSGGKIAEPTKLPKTYIAYACSVVYTCTVHVYSTQHVGYVVASNKDWLNMVAVLFSIKKRQRMSFWRSFYSRSFFYARNFPLKRSVGSRDVSVRYNQRNAVFSHEPIT